MGENERIAARETLEAFMAGADALQEHLEDLQGHVLKAAKECGIDTVGHDSDELLDRLAQLAQEGAGEVWLAERVSLLTEELGYEDETGDMPADAQLDLVKERFIECRNDLDATRRDYNELLDRSERQLPEGIKWPRYTDGELVRIGDEIDGGKVDMIVLNGSDYALWGGSALICTRPNDTPVPRPKPAEPEQPADSWEKLEKDTKKTPEKYWDCADIHCADCPSLIKGLRPYEYYEAGADSCVGAKEFDLVRRAKKLAGVE